MTAIAYNESFVVFVDILGFKSIIARLNESEIGELKTTLDQVRMMDAEADSPGYRVPDYYCKMFSDSIIISAPVHRISLFHLFNNVIKFQGAFSNRGVFLRGCITCGDHYEDVSTAFGPALVDAVDMEKTVAIWPRIIVHPSVLASYDKPHLRGSLPNEYDQITELTHQDNDGIVYLNYLKTYSRGLEYPSEFIKNHKNHIIKSAEENKSKLPVLIKYYWLANYHNHISVEMNYPNFLIDMSKTFPTL